MNEILGKLLSLFKASPAGSVTAAGGNEVIQQTPDLLKITQHNYRYHTNTYRALLNYAIAEALLICVLIVIAGWIIITAHPQDRFFVATVDGRISRIVPLDTPTIDNQQMYNRVGTAVANAFTFGFLDYEQRRMEISSIFEPEALTALHNALLGSGGVSAMAPEYRIYKTEVEASRPGGVIQQGVADHIYHWVISVPLAVTAKTGMAGDQQTLTRWTVVVNVERAKAIEATRGFMITSVLSAQPEGRPQPITGGGQ